MTAPQITAIVWANAQIASAQALMAWYKNQVELNNQFSDGGIATLLASCSTVTTGADGTQSTADGTPNTAHQISLAVYPTLGRPLSQTQLLQAQTAAAAVVAYINGQAVSTNPGARAILGATWGG